MFCVLTFPLSSMRTLDGIGSDHDEPRDIDATAADLPEAPTAVATPIDGALARPDFNKLARAKKLLKGGKIKEAFAAYADSGAAPSKEELRDAIDAAFGRVAEAYDTGGRFKLEQGVLVAAMTYTGDWLNASVNFDQLTATQHAHAIKVVVSMYLVMRDEESLNSFVGTAIANLGVGSRLRPDVELAFIAAMEEYGTTLPESTRTLLMRWREALQGFLLARDAYRLELMALMPEAPPLNDAVR